MGEDPDEDWAAMVFADGAYWAVAEALAVDGGERGVVWESMAARGDDDGGVQD